MLDAFQKSSILPLSTKYDIFYAFCEVKIIGKYLLRYANFAWFNKFGLCLA